MRQFRQIQSGRVTSNDAPDWLTELLTIYWTNVIIPNARTQSSFFNKFFTGILRAATLGSQPFFTFYVQRDGYSGADFSLPYARDVALEKGKSSDLESARCTLTQYFTKSQMKGLIDLTNKEEKLAKEQKRKSNSPWTASKLEKMYRAFEGGTKNVKKQNPTERKQRIQGEFIEIERVFQRGFGSPFYAYSYLLDGDDACVGESTNRNPTGEMPITYIYSLENLMNPYGKGLVEMGGHIQNILDSLVRDHILATSMGIRPPIDVHGDSQHVKFNSLVWDRDAIWETGDAVVKPVSVATTAFSNFPNTYGLYKTLLMNLLGISDMSPSSESGNPQYSKTDRGVAAQQERTTIHDSFRSQNTDTAFSRLASNLINTSVAYSQGSKVVDVLEDDIDRLNRAGFVDEDGNALTSRTVEMVWDNIRGDEKEPIPYIFEVDANSSYKDDSEAKNEAAVEVIKAHAEHPQMEEALARSGWRLDLGELYKGYLASKVSNIDKVLVKVGDGEHLPAVSQGTPEEIMEQYGLDAESAALFLQLRGRGLDDQQIFDYIDQEIAQ